MAESGVPPRSPLARTPSLEFELPLPQQLGNSRDHWAVKRKKRLAYWELLDTLVMARRLPAAPKRAWPKAEAVVVMRTWRQMDLDGAHSRCKDLFDWLQSRGYIVNDRDLSYQLRRQTAPRDELGITLVLTEAA